MSKWGIAGTGFISHAMLGAIARREGSEAVAISGRSAETRVGQAGRMNHQRIENLWRNDGLETLAIQLKPE